MNLISEEKLQSESLKQFRIVNGQLDASFRNGARFAENELQNLAIEFAKWLNDNYDMTENKYEWSDWSEIHTTEKCFELFIYWRSKQL